MRCCAASCRGNQRPEGAGAEKRLMGRRCEEALIRLAAAGIHLIHAGHAFRRQHCPNDPDDRDEKTEGEEDVVLVLERPDAKDDQENEIQDA
jgi:hypothetical protein